MSDIIVTYLGSILFIKYIYHNRVRVFPLPCTRFVKYDYSSRNYAWEMWCLMFITQFELFK